MNAATMLILLAAHGISLDCLAAGLHIERVDIDHWIAEDEVPRLYGEVIRWMCGFYFLLENCVPDEKSALAVGYLSSIASTRQADGQRKIA
jgi:hypothetical protein